MTVIQLIMMDAHLLARFKLVVKIVAVMAIQPLSLMKHVQLSVEMGLLLAQSSVMMGIQLRMMVVHQLVWTNIVI